jgi:peroxiredoxin (alkyl hydroperoxide reductase subunit C)
MATGAGCARPTGALVGEVPKETAPEMVEEKEIKMDTAKVGSKAPDFRAPAFHQGEFTEVSLSDYLDEWLLLCFYPGDFTFV